MPFEFAFTPDQEAFRSAVRGFLEREVAPHAAEIDESERFPAESVDKMRREGYFGVPIPEEFGGLGLGRIGYCILLEEVGRIDASHAAILGTHTSLGAIPILLYGSDPQRRRWLVPAAKGERLLAFSITEPGSGSDSGAVHTTATREGDGWRLTGTKIYVTNGAEADTVLVIAANDEKLGTNGGITAFLVDRGTPGFSVGRCERKMGLHGTSTAELVLEGVHVGAEHVLGEVGKGFHVAMSAIDTGRVSLGAGALGAIETAIGSSLEFSKHRTQFGVPISEFEAIQFKLADMTMRHRALRYLVYQAAARQERMGPDPSRWGRNDRLEKTRESAIVKCLASEWAIEAVDEAVQIHGGLGYIRGTPIERAYRDARILKIFEGTNEIQRVVIARDLIARGL